MIASLPKTVEFGGQTHPIRWDFRDVLEIIQAQEDCPEQERGMAAFLIFYPELEKIPPQDYLPAAQALRWFLACGREEEGDKPGPVLLSWTQDWNYIISAVNRVAGREVREMESVHWWTFVGWFMEIGECSLSQIISIRSKKARRQKLEKWEQEYYKQNKSVIDLKKQPSKEEQRMVDLLLGR